MTTSLTICSQTSDNLLAVRQALLAVKFQLSRLAALAGENVTASVLGQMNDVTSEIVQCIDGSNNRLKSMQSDLAGLTASLEAAREQAALAAAAIKTVASATLDGGAGETAKPSTTKAKPGKTGEAV